MNESIWQQTCEIKKQKPLNGDTETEIAVIGAGMAGILIAYELQKYGRQVIVLEANRIASGQTGCTTAKITSQHGYKYAQLIRDMGKEKARQYAMANETAIREYRRLIQEQKIDCDFEETQACLYFHQEDQLLSEAEAAANLGLPVSILSKVPLPVPNAGILCFNHQAQFHPLKFLQAICPVLKIYEKTSVQKVDGHKIITNRGIVTAEKIVFACHFPFINFPGFYFSRMHQERSYVLALKDAIQLDGMYIGAGQADYSFRNYGDLLLFGGGNHRTGESGKHYDTLREKARELFPRSKEMAHWSAQDCIPLDGVPYIGAFSSSRPDWYVATGFQKWGMTSSMAAAMLIRDAICQKENPYAPVFHPHRFSTRSAIQLLKESGHSIKGLTKRFLKPSQMLSMGLPLGCGGVVTHSGKKGGCYRDHCGRLHIVDIRCPHLGCQLEWNPDELTWDCPCHGSRFDYDGHLLSNPAQEDISHE